MNTIQCGIIVGTINVKYSQYCAHVACAQPEVEITQLWDNNTIFKLHLCDMHT